MTTHWFWFGLLIACLVWFSTITLYVAIRGAFDIRGMLGRLSDKHDAEMKEQENMKT
ncbi:MAG: hypothetical protein SGJ20_16740 [Planctomycetota bacterium]|nr:hypothetical protein [Planctomycetota bacterium]